MEAKQGTEVVRDSPGVQASHEARPDIRPVVHVSQLRRAGSRTARFEGRAHGSGISFFLVDADPGHGPGLHRHPYSETWVVLEGQATITIDGRELVAEADDCAVVPSGVWHGFVNTGSGALRMICIHASDVMVQEGFPPP
jgi:mannose-6-phosphate isomerase-like protein (cupin superfamily)